MNRTLLRITTTVTLLVVPEPMHWEWTTNPKDPEDHMLILTAWWLYVAVRFQPGESVQ